MANQSQNLKIQNSQCWTVDEVFEKTKSSHEGLTSQEAEQRLKKYGKNALKEEKINKLDILIRQFRSPLIYILIAASIMSLIIGDFTDFSVIIVIIAINGLIGFWQELKAETTLAELKKLTEAQSKVVRDGKMSIINSSNLVPGDYIVLHEGEMVTADIRLIEGDHLRVDEAPITGESMPVYKDPKAILSEEALPYELENMALAGTSIVGGVGKGIVVNTGSRTYFASIAEKTKEGSPDSPLTKSIKSFVKRYVILLIIILSILVGVGLYQGRSLIELANILLASLVSAVPEGLPLVITLVMVVGAVVLSRHKTLVRYLPSVETLGSATIIASDKTGTITAGELVVRETFTHDQEQLRIVAALCNDVHDGAGDPMDVALDDWVENGGEIRKNHPRIWTHSFDPELRLMATANKVGEEEKLFVKGAFESLKERSEEKKYSDLEDAFHSFLEKGLRVLAFGIGDARSKDPNDWELQIIGLIGFIDPPKKEVKDAVLSAKEAGIHVVMITGDHPKTAEAVAKDVSIWQESRESQVLTGVELENLSDAELAEKLEYTTVLARILPDHKHRVVKILQDYGEIVAVTGDGVNDVPALKAADLGIAMGGGTEAAKSVSKMVITDNNLRVIITSIKNGRVISDNIRKVIYYLVSTSIQEIILITLAILFALPLPLTAIQILWINLVTDGCQDKTFAFTKEEGNVMQRKPRNLKRKFLDRMQLLRILSFSIVIGLVCFILFYNIFDTVEFKKVSTIIFTSVVAAQWANGIQAQKEQEPFSINISRSFTINPYIFLGLLGGFFLQLVAIYLLPQLFDTVPMTISDWKYPVFVFFSSFIFVEIRKYIEFFWKSKSKRRKGQISSLG